MAAVFTARFPGRCAVDCGTRITEGDAVTYVDDELVHAGCADGLGPMPEPRAVDVCPHCRLVRPCEHDDDNPPA